MTGRIRALALLAATLAVLLGGLVLTRTAPEPVATKGGAGAQVTVEPAPDWRPPPLAAFAETLARPLFSPQRTRPAEQVAAAPAAARMRPLNVTLLGILAAQDGSGIAVVQRGGSPKAERLKLGQQIDGWVVAAIEPRRLVMRFGTEERQLTFPERSRPAAKTTKAGGAR